MAAPVRRQKRTVRELLLETDTFQDFFQAVRFTERMYPGKTPVGEGTDPGMEAVRFKSNILMSFPPGQIHEVREDADAGIPVEMTVNFMGLAGHGGPLPDVYSEYILERIRQKDFVLRDFLDLFNHRLISLFYKMRKTHRPGFETGSYGDAPWARYLGSLMGIGMESLSGRLDVDDRTLARYLSILAHKPKSLSALETMLSDLFATRISCRPFLGKWLEIDKEDRTFIGKTGQNQYLGESAVLGRRVWDQECRFEVLAQDLSRDVFSMFLPCGETWKFLAGVVDFYTDREFEFVVTLTIRAKKAPQAMLHPRKGTRLGWNSWISPERDTEKVYSVTLEGSRIWKKS